MPKKQSVNTGRLSMCPPTKHMVQRTSGTKFCRQNQAQGVPTAGTTYSGQPIYQVIKKNGKIVQYTITSGGNKRYLKFQRRLSEVF